MDVVENVKEEEEDRLIRLSRERRRYEAELFRELQKDLAVLATSEEKIDRLIRFLKEAISEESTPRFKDFWRARKICLDLFKERLHPAFRSRVWDEYVTIAKEAGRLKELFDEKAAFAREQIDLAITALEKDVKGYEDLLKNAPPFSLSHTSKTLEDKTEKYSSLQKEISLLNALVSRANSLRRELTPTDMRMRDKSLFFKRLFLIGTKIFGKRKELIKEMSLELQKDIYLFIESHFQEEQILGGSFHELRQEIKAMQHVAKILTLNTVVFTEIRKSLSDCWAKIGQLEITRKQQAQERREEGKENRKTIQVEVDSLKEKLKEDSISIEEARKYSDTIFDMIRSQKLLKDDVYGLKGALGKINSIIANKQKEEEEGKKGEENKKSLEVKEKIEGIHKEIAALIEGESKLELEALVEKKDKIQKEIESLELNKIAKQMLEKQLKPIRDLVLERKEKKQLDLSEDDRKSLDNLQTILEQRKERRKEIKQQMEDYRKALGGSGFDFEQAMQYRELIDLEKTRLEKADEGITEIEQKISELENN